MTAAVTGSGSQPQCTESFVRTYFDQFAPTFDSVLRDQLAYRGPEWVSAVLSRQITTKSANLDALDAGCGTGLCAPVLRPYCRFLVGVDLSGRMVERARATGLYDALNVAELCSYMNSVPNSFDIVVSSDVLSYFGALERVIGAAASALRYGGILLVTTEALAAGGTEPYHLQLNGRYAHRESYLRDVLANASLCVESVDKEFLRWERGSKVPFNCIAATRVPAADES